MYKAAIDRWRFAGYIYPKVRDMNISRIIAMNKKMERLKALKYLEMLNKCDKYTYFVHPDFSNN